MEILIRKTKKVFKTIGWTILVVLFMLVGFHIWFINHSEKAIERLIAWRSNGKLRAKIKKFSIDYFNNNAEIKELSIYNADTVSRGTAYRFTTQQLHFNIRSKWDLVFHKKLLIDSLIFSSPDIIITRKANFDSSFKKLPLAEELGNVYNAINNSLTVLNLERFEINDGKVKVKDAGENGKTRFELSRIFLLIDHLKIDSTNKTKHTFAFSDRVSLQILQQTVLLPDAQSSIAFKGLVIDSKLGVIEIAEPAIKIYPPAGLKNKFVASASQLNITGLDFNTLYSQPVINIDSVFMQNPQGDLQLYPNERKLKNKKQMPLDDALRNLPVAVNINHVVVKNGTVAVALHQAGKTTVFDTKNDNLNIAGISLNDTSSNVLNIKGFNYIVRNYIGYTPDSIYKYRFDSLQFIDNKIILYNFNIATIKKIQSILIRNYTVPKFEITDMDWFSFIFNNHFRARKAVLYDAKFNIEKNNALLIKNMSGNKKSIYQTLSVMDNLFDLDELKVVHGEFNARQGEDLTLHIGNLNWEINANQLTEAKTFKQLVQSVNELSFDTATATNAAMVLNVSKSNFNNRDKRLLFKHVLLNTNNQSITASLNAVAVSDFSFDNKELDVNEIQWKDGNIHINGRSISDPKAKPINNKNYAFSLNNISGNNTIVSFENDDIQAKINLKKLTASSLNKSLDNLPQLNNLFIDGENAIVNMETAQLTCASVLIEDEKKSIFKNISVVRKTSTDTAIVQLPLISFIPYINKTLAAKTIVIDSVLLQQPKINLTKVTKEDVNNIKPKNFELPAVKMNGFQINDAFVHLSFADEISNSVYDGQNVSLDIQKINTQVDKSLLLDKIAFQSNKVSLNTNGDILFTADGKINILADDFLFNPNTKKWKLHLNEIVADKFSFTNKEDAAAQKHLFVKQINVKNIVATSDDVSQGLPWLVNKSFAVVSLGSIHWQTPTTNLQAYGFLFDANKKVAMMDSLSIDPGKIQKEFVDQLIYRKAFIQASSGKLKAEGINYTNNLIHVSHILTDNALLKIYSDNLKKAKPLAIRPLPVDALKKIKLPLQIDTLQLKDMAIHYTEKNALTKQKGSVDFGNVNGNLLNIYTAPIQKADSLQLNITANFMDSLPMRFKMQAAYNDSLNNFALQVNVGKGNASILNPVFAPFVLLKTKSGFVDNMRMDIIGNDYKAHGTMQLNYHDLSVELLDSNITVRPQFKNRFYSFIANSFAVRNNNNKRITTFDVDRVRTKSTVSYLLKMVIAGAAGNVMPQASKIILKKQLKKEAKRQQLLAEESKVEESK